MPRPPRIEFVDATYHVTCRGNGRQTIFRDDTDRERFLAQLQERLETYRVVLFAYVLMRNHYHLLLRTPHANLSRFMQRLNTSYALYFAHKHRKPGHVFQGRFKGKLVQGENYLLRLTRYIHLNPVKIRPFTHVPNKERLAHLQEYWWSSYAGYVRQDREVDWVAYDVRDRYGKSRKEARRRYRGYVKGQVVEDDEVLMEAMEQSRYVLGDEDFVERIELELAERRLGNVRDQDVNLPVFEVHLDDIDEAVGKHFGVEIEVLSDHGGSSGLAKRMAVELAVRLTTLTQREIGAHYGGMTGQAVSMIRKKWRNAEAEEVKKLEKLQRKLTGSKPRATTTAAPRNRLFTV